MRKIKFELRYDNGLPNKIVTLAELANGLDKENGEHLFATARQYTNLKDKNGVEIYEDDILKHREHWSDGRTITTASMIVPFYCGDWSIEADECEVIGNIYQNPELLANK